MGRLVALILWALGSVTAHAALIPPLFINSVVALGSMQAVSSAAHHTEWQTVGTGFFYAYLVRDDTDPAKRVYDIYLVTAKHVIREFLAANSDVNVRINPNDSSVPVRNFAIPNRPSSGSGTWFCHPDESIDVAAVPISFDYLKQYGVAPNAFHSDQHAANRGKLRELEVAAGDGIFLLGFPIGLAGIQRNYVIVRRGAIGRISEMLDSASPTFLVNAFALPGDSGGPVVLKPDLTAIQGTKNQANAYLIGIVSGYRSYFNTARTTGRKDETIRLEENSGLAEVLPTDVIDEAIRASRNPLNPGGPPCH